MYWGTEVCYSSSTRSNELMRRALRRQNGVHAVSLSSSVLSGSACRSRRRLSLPGPADSEDCYSPVRPTTRKVSTLSAHTTDPVKHFPQASSEQPRKGNGPGTIQPLGIDRFRDWKFQSEVDTNIEPNPQLLVDQDEHKNNFELWAELLEFQTRIKGDSGVRHIWRGIRKRRLDLPTSGTVADRLWVPFTSVAAHDDNFRDEVWQYAKRLSKDTGRRWEGYFTALLAPVLERRPSTASAWFTQLKHSGFAEDARLQSLVKPAATSTSGRLAFREIYERHSDRCVYNHLLPVLCNLNLVRDTVFWHRFLLAHGDIPTDAGVVEQVAEKVRIIGSEYPLADFRKELVAAGVSLPRITAIDVVTPNSTIEHSTESKSVKEAPAVSGQPLSDHLTARAFATTAFSVSLIISGLLSFGLVRLGALAMRELAVRSASVDELSEHLLRMEREGVTLGDRVFTRVIRKIALDQNQQMLDAVLENDQHPDVYDDKPLQHKLLIQYVAQANWKQVNRTLTILTIFHHTPAQEAWNVVLREFMKAQNWPMINSTTKDMISRNIKVTTKTIKDSFFFLLRPRRPGHAPMNQKSTEKIDDLVFLTRLWLRILRHQGGVPPNVWKQVLISYGSGGRIWELEYLCLTLADLYSRRSRVSQPRVLAQFGVKVRFVRTRGSPQRNRIVGSPVAYILSQLFPPPMQRAIVEWGFKTLGRPLPPRSQPSSVYGIYHQSSVSSDKQHWDRGLRLLRLLQYRGLPVDMAAVRASCRTRMIILFGPESSAKRENRHAMSTNPHSIGHMVTRIHHILRKNLFVVPVRLLQNEEALKLSVLRLENRGSNMEIAP